MNGKLKWVMASLVTVAVGLFILSRTPLAGMFGLSQKSPTDIGL